MFSSSRSEFPAPSSGDVAARDAVLRRVKAEHRAFRRAWRDFERLDAASEVQGAEQLVKRFAQTLRVHGRFEREHLYPALRAISDDARGVERADVEHASLDSLLDRLDAATCGDAAYAALFEVVCDHVVQHIRREEAQLLPQLERAPVDWQGLAALLENESSAGAVPVHRPQSAPEMPEEARPVPPAAEGEAVHVVSSSPVPLATPADSTLPDNAVRTIADTPAERRAARRSAPIK